MDSKHPVFADTLDREVTFGATQPEYETIHGVRGDGPEYRVTYRFGLTDEEREHLAQGKADVMLTLLTFGNPQPVLLWVASEGAMRSIEVACSITGIPAVESAEDRLATLGSDTRLIYTKPDGSEVAVQGLQQLEPKKEE